MSAHNNTKQKSIVDADNIKTQKSKHTTIEISKSQKKKTREKGAKKLQNNQKTINKMAIVNPHLSVIALNVNRLHSAIKRH